MCVRGTFWEDIRGMGMLFLAQFCSLTAIFSQVISCSVFQPACLYSQEFLHHIRVKIICIISVTVPLRTPELSLTSHSSTDIQVSWQPLPAKVSRGRLSAYRLSYRTAADNTVTSVEIPQNSTEYLLEGLQPDTIYLLRMAAATRVGWCEPSAWTSHRTPRTSSSKGKRSLTTWLCRAVLLTSSVSVANVFLHDHIFSYS